MRDKIMEVLQNNHRSNLFSAIAREKLATEIMDILSTDDKNSSNESDNTERDNSGISSSIFERSDQQKPSTFVSIDPVEASRFQNKQIAFDKEIELNKMRAKASVQTKTSEVDTKTKSSKGKESVKKASAKKSKNSVRKRKSTRTEDAPASKALRKKHPRRDRESEVDFPHKVKRSDVPVGNSPRVGPKKSEKNKRRRPMPNPDVNPPTQKDNPPADKDEK